MKLFVRHGRDSKWCWENPNHGFEDISQLSIFLNGLRSDTKMLLDAAADDIMMVVDVRQVTRIIDALTSTDYQAQHDKQDI